MSDHQMQSLATTNRSVQDSRAHRRCGRTTGSVSAALARAGIAVLVVSLGLTFGCASLNLKSPTTWLSSESDQPQAPKSITAVWSPAVLERADGTRARGFGGRVMFYPVKGHKPTRVDGTLIVYAYEEQEGNSEQARANRKYVITRPQLASHHSKSELGDSYSIWIPWDHVDSATKQVSLIVRFSAAEGTAVVSEQAKVTLTGSNASPIAACPTTNSSSGGGPATTPVRAASHETPAEDADATSESPASQHQMVTTTIRVPARPKQR